MNNSVLDVIVAGAGQAGLSASYFLKKYGLSHIVFECGKIGESWRSQRWNSFVLNSANKLNVLPGDSYKGNDPDGFCPAGTFVSSLEEYAETFQLPVSENTKIISVEKDEESGLFKINVLKNNNIGNYYCRQVIIASGAQNKKKLPAFAGSISSHIKQLPAGEYRSAGELPDGAVLVVGSAQSGCQVAEDLIDAGRKVYLSTSMVPRVPRRYRGKDVLDWLLEMKFFDVWKEETTDPAMLQMKAPQMTGKGDGTKTISIQALAKKGATILGKMENANEEDLCFQPNAVMHVKFADGFSGKVKSTIDEFILANQLAAPAPEFDAADIADADTSCASQITLLKAKENNISTIIWATGFKGDFSYIKLPVFDSNGHPKHQNGISDTKGLYFLGFPWLRSLKSALIHGIKDDAEFICEKVYHHTFKHIPLSVG